MSLPFSFALQDCAEPVLACPPFRNGESSFVRRSTALRTGFGGCLHIFFGSAPFDPLLPTP